MSEAEALREWLHKAWEKGRLAAELEERIRRGMPLQQAVREYEALHGFDPPKKEKQ